MSEAFDEFLMDSRLGIKTTGRNDKHAGLHYYPYEPTDYAVLERIVQAEFLEKEDVLLDYGCGMGRVPIFMHDKIGCKGIGVENVKEFYKQAVENVKHCGKEEELQFVCGNAEKYSVPDDVTACFFFNPFDIGVFRGVMKQIVESYQRRNRRIRLFCYYPHVEYIACLASMPEVDFVDEIDCKDLFAKQDARNLVMIYEIGGLFVKPRQS